MMVGEDARITNAQFQACVSVGLFPIPPKGEPFASMFEPGEAPPPPGHRPQMQSQTPPAGPASLPLNCTPAWFPGEFQAMRNEYNSRDPSARALRPYLLSLLALTIYFVLLFLPWSSSLVTLGSNQRSLFGLTALFTFALQLNRLRPRPALCPLDILHRPLQDPKKSSRVAVVTGGSSGVGREIVKQLLRWRIGTVVFTSRSKIRGLQAAQQMKSELLAEGVEGGYLSTAIEVHELDLSDLDSVTTFTQTLAGKNYRLDYVVFNAGQLTFERQLNSKLHLDANFLGHFLLAKYFFLVIAQSGGRLVSTSDIKYLNCESLDIERILSLDDPIASYSASKGLGILFTHEIAIRFQQIAQHEKGVPLAHAYSFHPGVVRSQFKTRSLATVHSPTPYASDSTFARIMRVILSIGLPISISPLQGAQTAFYLLAEDTRNLTSGGFYMQCDETPTVLTCDFRREEVRNSAQKTWLAANGIVGKYSLEK